MAFICKFGCGIDMLLRFIFGSFLFASISAGASDIRYFVFPLDGSALFAVANMILCFFFRFSSVMPSIAVDMLHF